MIAWLTALHARGNTGLWLGLAAFFALVAAGWVGFIASDDATYAIGAFGWLEHFPFVGGHGTIRYPITIPMALSFLIVGQNEFAAALPSLIYVSAFLVMAWASVRTVAGALPATGALLVIATSPLIVIQSSIAGVDVIEMAFLFGSVMLTWRCLDTGPRPRLLFAAGVLAGLAFLTRETAIFVAVFYALLFLVGHRFHRLHYLWIAAGFLAVWLAELAWLGIMTGDPLYRFNIALHHDSTIDRTIDLAGNVIVNPLVDPLLVLLLNQEFMALFYLAVPLAGWLCFGKSIEPRLKHFARIVALFGLVWFVCVAAAQSLLPLNPRYFMITSSMACLLTGLALARLVTQGTRRVQIAALLAWGLLVGGNLAGIAVENRDPVFGEKVLASIAARLPDDRMISTDPVTRYRAGVALRWVGAQPRVNAATPRPGDFYFHNPARAGSSFRPRPGWRAIGSYEPDPSLLARAIEVARIEPFLPQGLWHKLRHHHPAVTLYRVNRPEG